MKIPAKTKLMTVVLGAALLGACATKEEVNTKYNELDEKINQALRNSAAAKIDAATALNIAAEKNR